MHRCAAVSYSISGKCGRLLSSKPRFKPKKIQNVLSAIKSNSEKAKSPNKGHLTASAVQNMVLYEDGDILAVNKPGGYAVQGGPKVEHSLLQTVQNLWRQSLGSAAEDLALAHRLDKDVSGVLVFTKNASAAARVATMFSSRSIQKKYSALTVGVPANSEGSICIPIVEKNVASGYSANGVRKRTFKRVLCRHLQGTVSKEMVGKPHPLQPSAKVARTDYRVLGSRGPKWALVEVQPYTGYKHQIRAHLAEGLLTPIAGDYKYGSAQLRRSEKLRVCNAFLKYRIPDSTVYLHAHQLVLPDYKNGLSLNIIAPLPKHFLEALQTLGVSDVEELYGDTSVLQPKAVLE